MRKRNLLQKLAMLMLMTAICLTCNSASVQADTKNGLVNVDGKWLYFENGNWVKDKYGFVSYKGSSFLVANGAVADLSGLVLFDNTWYFLANGQLQNTYTGLALYDGEWFYVRNGILPLDYNGIQDYDGSKFLVAAGRVLYTYSGLFENTDGNWYYIANGQVQTQYTGLAEYDGAWFYLENGMLAKNYTGEVSYNGTQFYVEKGMVNENYRWKIAYRNIVDDWHKKYGKDASYELIYLNNDEIPELCVTGRDWMSFTNIYTIINGQAVQIKDFNTDGSENSYIWENSAYKGQSYIEKSGLLFDREHGASGNFTRVYEMNGNRLECVVYHYGLFNGGGKHQVTYRKKDGTMVEIPMTECKEDCAEFEYCSERVAFEKEYGVSIEEEYQISLIYSTSGMTYAEMMQKLQ